MIVQGLVGPTKPLYVHILLLSSDSGKFRSLLDREGVTSKQCCIILKVVEYKQTD